MFESCAASNNDITRGCLCMGEMATTDDEFAREYECARAAHGTHLATFAKEHLGAGRRIVLVTVSTHGAVARANAYM